MFCSCARSSLWETAGGGCRLGFAYRLVPMLAAKTGGPADWMCARRDLVAVTCGYGLYRQLSDLGSEYIVVAPSLIPMKAGDRVKTDRRDAGMLAKLHRAGELTSVWVPDDPHKAMQDDPRPHHGGRVLGKARQHLQGFLLRRIYPGKKADGRLPAWLVIVPAPCIASSRVSVAQQVSFRTVAWLLSRLARSRSIARSPPLKPRLADVALPSGVFGPVDRCHGFH